MAKVRTISTQPFRLEMKGSLSWGKASRLEALEHVLVRVVTDDGYVGVAEAPLRPTIYGETVASVEATVKELLAPKLEGLDLADETSIRGILGSIPNNHTARGALDIALHDARAQAAGTTLLEAQRGEQKHIRVSFILGISDLATMLSEARDFCTRGERL